jgi:Ethanolamine utilization protein EutJ (predicted chaperonin)
MEDIFDALDSEAPSFPYIVGIDLGTTNSAFAFVDRTKEGREARRIRFLDIPQLSGPAELGRRAMLPSFLYIPGSYDLSPESTALPWDPAPGYIVGEFAREQGARVPGRLVSSAKSWLCHGGVDRTSPILPWGAGSDVEKVSPVTATSRYLRHMRQAWNSLAGHDREGLRLEDQLVVLTVPASFDEVARELTVTAARDAGLARVVLLEEPLAAFYSWLCAHEDSWAEKMQAGQIILVCDVGGGTTDFTVVAVRQGEQGLRFDRLAVGDHLMLGGDNMDLLLARQLEMRLTGKSGQLDSKRWHQLWHQCRKAKEILLGGDRKSSQKRMEIVISGTGSKLIADTFKASLTLEEVEETIIEGFFPYTGLDETPAGGRRAGLTEWGLPYVQDPAVTRHLGAFWQRFKALIERESGRTSPYPDFVLFNGGAFTPRAVRVRMLSVIQRWFQDQAGSDWAPVELGNPHPELAVAAGAAYYGMVRQGDGVRVGAGSPRAYFAEVGAQASGSGAFVCIVARGTEEGYEARLEKPSFELLTNRPVSFKLCCSSTRLGDRPGDVVSLEEGEITSLPPIRTVLRYGKKSIDRRLPVQLAVRLTEIGTLELWCRSQESSHRWQLQFDVRQGGEQQVPPGLSEGETLDADLIEEALNEIRTVFSSLTNSPEELVKKLVSILGLKKEKWPTPLIRKFADALLECSKGRTLSAAHESRWLNLLGFCLRPGFGAVLDQWRIKEAWKIYPRGLAFPKQPQVRSEWWIFWRRVAAGLSANHQNHIYLQVSPLFQTGDTKKKQAKKVVLHPGSQEALELWMAMANFERLSASIKTSLGELLLQKIRKGKFKSQELWALSRLGARSPFYGPLDQVVSVSDVSQWLETLLSFPITSNEALAHAVVQLARKTGDRQRDLAQADLDRVAAWLDQAENAKRYRQLLENPQSAIDRQEQDWVFGENLPSGLILS